VEQALNKIRRQESGMDFQRLPLHEIVCISGLWIDEKGFDCFHLVRSIILKLKFY
jgi:predicted PolB exonuclease-like 3'-5' exonuclease